MKKILLLIPLLVILFGCKDNKVEPIVDTDSIEYLYPFLKIGHQWQYQRVGTDGMETNIDTITSKITETRDTLERTYYIGSTPKDIIWNVHTTSKVLAMESIISNIIDDKMFTFPLLYKDYSVGHSWSSADTNSTIFDRKVVSITEKVVVPLGTFENCIKIVTITNSIMVEAIYFRKDIGLVKYEFPSGENGGISTINLISKNF